MAVDLVDLPLFNLLKTTVHFNADVNAQTEIWIGELGTFEPKSHSHEDALVMLESMTNALEDMIEKRLEARSLAFWLTIFRTIVALNPRSRFSDPDDLTRDSRMIELSIAKHSSYLPSDLSRADNIWYVAPNGRDIANLLEVAALSRLATTFGGNIKRLSHGGELLRSADGWTVELNPMLNGLMQVHRSRQQSHGNILRFSGAPGKPVLPAGPGQYSIALAGRNDNNWVWSGRDQAMLPIHLQASVGDFVTPVDSYIPTFVLLEFNIDEEVKWLKPAAQQIQQTIGINIYAVLAILRACAVLGFNAFYSYRLGHRLRSLGFLVVSTRELLECATVEASRETSEPRVTSAHIEAALNFLTRDDTLRESINVEVLSGFSSIVRLDEQELLLDFNATAGAIQNLFRLLAKVSGRAADVRGKTFEDHVAAEMLEAVPGSSLWGLRKDVAFADDFRSDVDVGVVVDDVMILCECKASALHGFENVQDRDQVQKRWEHWQRRLAKIDAVAARLASDADREGQTLPPHVRELLPCVITTGVEWIPDCDPVYWFEASEIPRICVASELVAIAKRLRAGSRFGNVKTVARSRHF